MLAWQPLQDLPVTQTFHNLLDIYFAARPASTGPGAEHCQDFAFLSQRFPTSRCDGRLDRIGRILNEAQ